MLIERARARVMDDYVERHHIVPHCMGGTDVIENVVQLTPEEHFDAHMLLAKLHPNHRGLVYAAFLMSGKEKYGRAKYAWLRRLYSDSRRETPLSDAHKLAIGASSKGRPMQEIQKAAMSVRFKGKPLSSEHRAAISAALRGRSLSDSNRAAIGAAHKGVPLSAEHRASISSTLKGKTLSVEHRAAISAGHKGKPWTDARRAACDARKQEAASR